MCACTWRKEREREREGMCKVGVLVIIANRVHTAFSIKKASDMGNYLSEHITAEKSDLPVSNLQNSTLRISRTILYPLSTTKHYTQW